MGDGHEARRLSRLPEVDPRRTDGDRDAPFLAGVFMTADVARTGEDELAGSLRRRTLVVGVVTGGVVLAGLVSLATDAPALWSGLTGSAVLSMLGVRFNWWCSQR